ncbi:MAG: hypothetical protein ACYCWE_02270 [Eubacteriales bacterium]
MYKKQQLGLSSMLTGLCALNTLLFGVIPSIKFDSLDVAVGFYDIIQYIPVLQAVFAVLCMSSVIMTVIFSFISVIPRRVSFVTASSAFVTSLAAVVTLDAGVIYISKGFGGYELLSAGRGFNYGLEYNFIIILFLLFNLICAFLAAASWIRYDKGSNKQNNAVKQQAVLKQRHSEKNINFKPPEDL